MPKVMGIETEYGITVPGLTEFNPVLGSSMLINAYVAHTSRRVRWDYEEESPLRDARGFEHAREPAGPSEEDLGLANAILTNGARYYVDHAHPEYSTPECLCPRELVAHDKAGERILARSIERASELLPSGRRMLVYKNNTDGKGASYGCHENYLVDRETPFARLAGEVLPFFVSRQVFCGAGSLGGPVAGEFGPYQISQRADFFEAEVGLETTLKRPIVNTRDEPHADPEKYRRFHVIIGDANMSEVAILLKVGTTALTLMMIEDDAITGDFALESPVQALRRISHDPSCGATVSLRSGRAVRAVDIQWGYFEMAEKYLMRHEAPEWAGEVMARWEHVLGALETDPMSLDRELDWVAKWTLLSSYRDRDGLRWTDPKLQMMDLQYHDVREGRGLASVLARNGKLERLVPEDDVRDAVDRPPRSTRAYFRGRCLAQFPGEIAAASWDSVIFDVGGDTLRRVPMMEPLRGTEAHVKPVLDECRTAADLIGRLQG
ncbi:MAG: proteasome accessory factor PafA2 [Acidobacteria bacterium]|nr:proteasome accessory factor PafA2 [Acidobacteriota bacterium]